MQLNVVSTLIGTVEVEGPVLTNNSGKTFKTAEVFDINGSFLGSPLVPFTVGVKSACQ